MAKVGKSEDQQSELGSLTKEISKAANAPGNDEIAVDGTQQQGDIFKTETVAAQSSSTFNFTGRHANDGVTSSSYESDDGTVISSHDGLDEVLYCR